MRVSEVISRGSEWKIDALRHGDWIVTMPLLVLKLHALVGGNSDHDTILHTVDLAAFIAALMIACGAFARLGYDELHNWGEMDGFDKARESRIHSLILNAGLKQANASFRVQYSRVYTARSL